MTNNGSNATGVVVTDTLPASVKYLSDTGLCSGVAVGATGTLTCNVGDLAKDASTSFTVTVTAPATPKILTNTASVSANEADIDTADNTAEESTEILPAIDLAIISGVVTPTVANTGETFVFTAEVQNNGPFDATQVTLTDVLPAGIDYVAATGTDWVCNYNDANRTVTCVYLKTLLNGATAPDVSISTVAIGFSASAINNTLEVSTPDFTESDISNNATTLSINVIASADLHIEKTVDKPGSAAGSSVAFTLLATNHGPDKVTDMVITDTFNYNEKDVAGGYSEYKDDGKLNSDKYTVTFPDGNILEYDKDLDTPQTLTSSGVSIALNISPNTYPPANGTPIVMTWTQTAGDLLAGEAIVVNYEAKTAIDGSNLNTGWVSSSLPDPVTANDADMEVVEKDKKGVDLKLTKTGSSGPVLAGTPFIYTLSVLNMGEEKLAKDPLTIVTITDTLPEGVTLVSTSTTDAINNDYKSGDTTDQWSCTGTTTLSCTFPVTANDFTNDKYLHDLNLTVVSTTAGVKLNKATVSYVDINDFVDVNESNNTDTHSLTVIHSDIDVSLTKSVDNPTPNLNDNVSFTITLTNHGFSKGTNDGLKATDVVIKDALPAGLSLVSFTASQGAYADDIWYVGDVEDVDSGSGGVASLTVVAKVESIAAMTNTAIVLSAAQPLKDTGDDTASVMVSPPNADLAISKTLMTALPLNYHDNATFRITLTNNGPQDATGVVVTDTLPAGLTVLEPSTDIIASVGSAVQTGQVISWTIPAFNNGETATLDVTVKLESGEPLTNTVTISGADQPDADPTNNTDSAPIDAIAIDIDLKKTVELTTDNGSASTAEAPGIGDVVTYTITAQNKGPDEATALNILEALPAVGIDLATVVITPSAGSSYDPLSHIWTIPTLAATDSATLAVTATVNDSGNVTNTVQLSSVDQTDMNSANNSASVTILAGGIADLYLEKTVDNTTPFAGNTVVFRIELNNFGPESASGVVLQDTLPTGLTYVSDDGGASTSESGGVISWNVSSILESSPQVLYVTATVDAGTVDQSLTNVVSIIDSDQADPDAIGNSASSTVLVQQSLASHDFGDAPAPYKTLLTDNGPHHIYSEGGLKLGSMTSEESDGYREGTDDNGDATDDNSDDGVRVNGSSLQGQTVNSDLMLNLEVLTTGSGQLHGWIDWDRDGVFGSRPDERVVSESIASSGTRYLSIDPPDDVVDGISVARFRYSTFSTTTASRRARSLRSGTTASPTGSAPDGEVEDYLLNLVSAVTISGRVYNDANVDQLNSPGEIGVSELPAILYDTATGTCRSTRTHADGSYYFKGVLPGDYQVYEASREQVPVPIICDPAAARNPSGYLSSTANVSAVFTVADAPITGVDFGDVLPPTFELDHHKAVLPNTSVVYPHIFTARSDGSVTFTGSSVGSPDGLVWGMQVYHDNNCDSMMDAGDTLATSAVALNTGDQACVLVKVITPADAAPNALHVIGLDVDFVYGDGSSGVPDYHYAHSDITRVLAGPDKPSIEPGDPVTGEPIDPVGQAGQLELVKSVWNMTRNINGNVALPGETLRYTIEYINVGNGALNELVIHDSAPEFTELVGGSMLCNDALAGLPPCIKNNSFESLSWAWTSGDKVQPGASGSVSFEVVVE